MFGLLKEKHLGLVSALLLLLPAMAMGTTPTKISLPEISQRVAPSAAAQAMPKAQQRATMRQDGDSQRGNTPFQEVDLTEQMGKETGPVHHLTAEQRAQVDALTDPHFLRQLRQGPLSADKSSRLPHLGDPRPQTTNRDLPWSGNQLLANPTNMNDEYISLAHSPLTGNLYAVFAAKDLGGTDRDIHIAVSENDGQSWTVHEMPASAIDEYHPEVAVDGGGYIHVVWVRDDGWILRARTASPDDVTDWAWVKGLGTEETMATPSIAVSGAGDFAKVFIAAGWLTANWDLYQMEWTLVFMYSTNGGQTVTYDYFMPDGYMDLWPDVTMNTTGTVHFVNAQVDYYTGETEILVASDAYTGSFGDVSLLTDYTPNNCGYPQIAGQGDNVFIVFQEDYTDGMTVDGDIIYTFSWDGGQSYYGPFGLVADEFESVGPSVFTRDGVVGVLWLDGPAGADEFQLGARLGGGFGHADFFGNVEMVTEEPRVEPMFHSCFGMVDGDLIHAAWIDRRDYPTQGHNVYTSRQLVAPNIAPFVPEGWSDSLVGNVIRSNRTTGFLASEDTTYISFAFSNNGLAAFEQDFALELLLDGGPFQGHSLGQWTLSGGMATGTYFPVEEIPIFVEEEGQYSLTVNLDLLDDVSESNETDNTDSRLWTWVPGAAEMRITPGHISKSVIPEMSKSEALGFVAQPLLRHEASLPVIQTDLAAAMDAASRDQLLRVMIVPVERLDPLAMGQALRQASKMTRRQVITEAAKAQTKRSWDKLASELQSLNTQGLASNSQPLWLTGTISVQLTADGVEQLAMNPEVGSIFLDNSLSETFGATGAPIGKSGATVTGNPDQRADAWHLATIGADIAWAQGATGEGIVVGHLDSGVAYDNPDLQHAMWDGGSEYPYHGWDAVDDDADPFDGDTDYWHGTHTAGLIVGNGTGGITTGAAPDATLMALRALPGYLDDMIEAMQFGLDNGVHLFNLSGGWSQASDSIRGANRYNAELLLSIDVAWICAAGNGDNYGSHYQVPTNIATPGDCPNPWYAPGGGTTGVITIGAVHQDHSVWAFSSYGPTEWDMDNGYGESDYHDYPYTPGLMKPDLATPGGDITSCTGYGDYVVYSGTSMATPLATAAVCLIWSQSPLLLVPQVAELLESTATDLTASPAEAGRDNYTGAGLIDIPAALGQTPTAEAEIFWIHNDGDLPLIIHDIQWTDTWLDVVVADMVIAPDDSVRATAFIDPANVTEGYYNANVVFLTNEHRPGRVLPITLIYGDQHSPVDGGTPPAVFTKMTNYPNPFNPRTVLRFTALGEGRSQLTIYDVRGRLVRTLVNQHLDAGPQEITWDGLDEAGSSVSSGPYFARFQEGQENPVSRKLMLVR